SGNDIKLLGMVRRAAFFAAGCDSFEIEADTQTDGVVSPGRHQLVTTSRAEMIGIDAPRSATHHSMCSRIRPLRINNVILGILAVPILTPLPNIAMHVVQSPRIRWEAAHGDRLFPVQALLSIPVYGIAEVVRLIRGDVLAEVKWRCRPGT